MTEPFKKYRGYSMFNHIEDPNLRAWNRTVTTFNLRKVHNEFFIEYLGLLDEAGKNQVLAMIKYIKAVGYNQARINVFGKLKCVGGKQ